MVNIPVPSSVRFTRNGITYLSNVERAKYTLQELQRAALRDIGKYLRRLSLQQVRQLRGLRRGKRPVNAFQYWVRRQETDLIIGIKHNTWYGVDQELGTSKQPRRAILTNVSISNITEMRRIAAQYLSAIEDQLRAEGLINENDEGGEDNAE